jgi:hypothetical protein
MAGEDANGVSSAGNPQVAAYLESELRRWQPKIRRLPETRTLRTGIGEASVLAFDVPDAGLRIEAYAVLHQGSAVLMLHAAREDLLQKRRAEMSGLFTSLAQGLAPAPVELGLAGAWRRSQYIRTSSITPGVIPSTTYFFFLFAADGTFRFIERDHISGNTADLGVMLSRDNGAIVRVGRRSVLEGSSTLRWADGAVETYPYSVSATTLRLPLSGGRRPWVFERMPAP